MRSRSDLLREVVKAQANVPPISFLQWLQKRSKGKNIHAIIIKSGVQLLEIHMKRPNKIDQHGLINEEASEENMYI